MYDAVRERVDEWGIERNEEGWTADAFLYCNEAVDPVSGWRVPLAPSWVVAEATRTIVRLIPDPSCKSFNFQVVANVSPEEVEQARAEGTW